MFFKKKKDVDLRDLQRKGIIRIPRNDVEVKTDRNGFVDMRSSQTNSSSSSSDNLSSSKEGPGFLGFLDSSSSSQTTTPTNPFSEEDKREMTRKFEEIDNKIYKLEQRIELLERKSGVGGSSAYSWQ